MTVVAALRRPNWSIRGEDWGWGVGEVAEEEMGHGGDEIEEDGEQVGDDTTIVK